MMGISNVSFHRKGVLFQISNFKWILIGIVTLAAVLRFAFFGLTPPALNWDEASLGYNAYSILKTGKDEWNRFLPLTFEAFGDYKLPGYIYAAVPFVFFLDLNEFSVRLPSMLAGVFSALLIYLIARKLFDSEAVGLISALLLAISPWHTFLSRVALEANLAFSFFLLAVYFLLRGFERKLYFNFASVFFGLTLFTYNSARVFVPLFLISLFIFNLKKVRTKLKDLIVPFIIFAIFFGSASYLALTQDSASRYYWVTILDEGAINQINQLQGARQFGNETKLVYNKYSYFGSHFVANYLSHFSLKFLFLEGGTNYQFSVPKMGLLYWVELPFLLLGVYGLFKNKKVFVFVLSWLLAAPVAASITRESPHVLRSIFMLGSLQLITGFGVIWFFRAFSKQWKLLKWGLPVALGLALFFSSLNYFYNYFFLYPESYSQSWQYGYKEAISFANTRENLNSRPLFFTKKYGEPQIFYLFYNKYDPVKYQNNPTLVRYARSNWRWVDRLDNVYFINDWEMKEKLKDMHGYVITTEGNYIGIPPILKTVKFLDGSTAFEVVEI